MRRPFFTPSPDVPDIMRFSVGDFYGNATVERGHITGASLFDGDRLIGEWSIYDMPAMEAV